MRSLHRYASDAAVVLLTLHIIREFSIDHQRGKHWFSWVSGIPLIWLLFLLGITGYWLVWDELAQYVALQTAELLDSLPIFTNSMARNFLADSNLSNRFFTLLIFLHVVGLPIFFVFAIWLHVFRINGPRINPPRGLMAATLITMVVLSLLYPAFSQDKADLRQISESLSLDWFYLLVYPLIQSWSPAGVWGLLIGITCLLLLAPWLPPAKAKQVALVDLGNCNGCERCADDCPYSAISMMPRSDESAHEQEAVVDPELCVSCGICVGACPTAMPFRSRSELIPGIDLPGLSAADLRTMLHKAAAEFSGSQRIMIITCQADGETKNLKRQYEGVVEVACMGHLPPSYIDYILSRDLADGVLMTGCGENECKYRFGMMWTQQRINRQRDPLLRNRVDQQRIALAWLAPWTNYRNTDERFNAFAQTLYPSQIKPDVQANKKYAMLQNKPVRLVAVGTTCIVLMFIVARFSNWPMIKLRGGNQAIVSLSFSHAGQLVHECRKLTQAELDELPANMRKAEDCERERQAVDVIFKLDDIILYQQTLAPTGIWKDGEVTVYQRLKIPYGQHQVFVGMRDSKKANGYDYEYFTELELSPGQHELIEFDNTLKKFVIN